MEYLNIIMQQEIIQSQVYMDTGYTLDMGSTYAVGIQAVPGTQFCFNKSNMNEINDNDIITMGPSGIYQINFFEPIIESITFTKIVGSSPIIVDYITSEVK